jgi:RHS repeat-associated protein
VFDYDLNDQAIAMQLNILNPDTTSAGSQTISYDANGNRTWFQPPGWNEQYTTDNLSQYTSINGSQLTYRADANLATYNDTYNYDAQNRLTSVSNTATFKYDGLNRQVSRTVGGANTYNVYDGWDLIEECQANGTLQALYVYGTGGLVLSLNTWTPFWKYHYQDGSGSTSHLADTSGNLLEWYRYDLDGTPIFYGPNDIARSPQNSAYGVRHLFTGQQWYSEVGLYDLRNRFYSPDIGRFLQPDPIGFGGDATNLYRYCANNPVVFADPTGLNIQLWTTPTGGTTPWHAYWGVTTPNGMVYYDFSPQGDPGSFAETFGSVPGDWNVHDYVPDTASLMAEWETTPGQDYAVYDALDQASQPGNADPYSAPYNNCYSVPERIIADALSGEDDAEEQADAFTGYFTSSVSSPIGAFGVGGQGGSFFNANTPGGRYFGAPGGVNIGNLGGGGPVNLDALGGSIRAPWYYGGRSGGHSTDTPKGLGMMKYTRRQHAELQRLLAGRGARGLQPSLSRHTPMKLTK